MDLANYMGIAVDLCWQVRNKNKENCGFKEEEVEPLRKEYDRYSNTDGLHPDNLKMLVRNLYPDIWLSVEARRGLVTILEPYVAANSAPSQFPEFLKLARQCVDLQEMDMNEKEALAVKMTNFTFDEVHKFRLIYLGEAGERPNGMTYQELKDLMKGF